MSSWKKVLSVIEAQKYRYMKKNMAQRVVSLRRSYFINEKLPNDTAIVYVERSTYEKIKEEISIADDLLKKVTTQMEDISTEDVLAKLTEGAVFVSSADFASKVVGISRSSYRDGVFKTANEQLKKFDFGDDLGISEKSSMIFDLDEIHNMLKEIEGDLLGCQSGIKTPNGSTKRVKNEADAAEIGSVTKSPNGCPNVEKEGGSVGKSTTGPNNDKEYESGSDSSDSDSDDENGYMGSIIKRVFRYFKRDH